MRGTIRIRLLGSVEVLAEGVDVPGTKQASLLAALAVRVGEVVATDRLTEALWPTGGPSDPERSLQVHVSNLRRTLTAAGLDASIEHRSPGYVLHIEPQLIDVHRFEELVTEGTGVLAHDPERARELLDEALALWHGRPLGPLADHAAIHGVVAHLEERRLRAVEAKLDAELATGRHDAAIDALRTWTAEHPLREGLWERLMLALYRAGRQAEALDAYESARAILAEQLGVDPSPGLRGLHGRILRQDPALEAPTAVRPASTGADAAVDPASIAVLPFAVLGGGDDAALLALGLHNDLLTELSKVPGLTVISRTSVLGYADTDRPIPSIARDLNVAAIAEGTVQCAGSRLRLTVQLIDGRRDVHLWADSYDGELSAENLFAVQTALAHEIATSLSAELAPPSGSHGAELPRTDSLDAYRLAAKARQQHELRTADGFRRAVALYREALEIDPDYVDAWVGLADALTLTDSYGHGDRHELLPAAERAVHRALALDADSAAAQTALGTLHTMYQDGPAATQALERAIALQPGHADAHNMYCWVLLLTGRAREGFEQAVRTVELDPLSAEPHAHLALAHAATGDPAAGVQEARRAGRFSAYSTAAFYEGICLSELGQHAEARRVLQPLTVDVLGEPGVPWSGQGPEALVTVSLAALGEHDAAREVAGGIDAVAHPFAAGLAHLALGELDAASQAFARVDTTTAWPCLAFHHYHRALWETIVGTEVHHALTRTVHRSWRLGPPDAPPR